MTEAGGDHAGASGGDEMVNKRDHPDAGGRPEKDGGANAPVPDDRRRATAARSGPMAAGAAQPSPRRFKTAREGPMATVTLDHPAKHNVLDREAWDGLGAHFEALAADRAIRCVILRGAGGRAFSAGSDIGAFGEQRGSPDQVARYAAAVARGLNGVRDCPHPTVAIVEGLCVGGGMILAACCDVAVCGESSRFGAPINRLGLTMAYEEMAPLAAAIGARAVTELLVTGDLVDARRARELGLVARVAPDGEAAAAGWEIARRIAAGAPLVNRWHKKFARRLDDPRPIAEAERAEAYEAYRTRDYREGTAAFMEKREPRFRGE